VLMPGVNDQTEAQAPNIRHQSVSDYAVARRLSAGNFTDGWGACLLRVERTGM
jgi:hypothetical protein